MNYLQLLPARARTTVAILCMLIGAAAPILINELPILLGEAATPWTLAISCLAAIAAGFGGSVWISNITPDSENPTALCE